MPRWISSSRDTKPLVDQITQEAVPVANSSDLDLLIEQIGDARIVMLGEASHGTSDFYTWRARISQRLIREKGFSFIAVEGDWPDCYEINRYIKGYPGSGESAFQVLNAFDRWPTWMWANWEIVALAEWLKQHNRTARQKAGFYGLDVYSLWESMRAVVDYLENKDPEMARLARQAYRCFEPYAEDVQSYAWSTRMTPDTCEREVVELLHELRGRGASYDGDPEAGLNAEQNALVMVGAERYYRAMVRSDQNSWNVRDSHMAETLDRLLNHHGENAKAVVWAHNTHVGDARATDMASAGMVNIGQLAREQYGEGSVFLLGFSTHHGTVIAGQEWGAPMEVMGVPDGTEGSWEDIFHQAAGQMNQMAIYINTRGAVEQETVNRERGHRAIGVVYNPLHERFGNYVPTRLASRYDGVIFIDETRALHPLHLQEKEDYKTMQVPETYPWGL